MHKELYYNSSLTQFNDGWKFTAPDGAVEKDVTLPHSWNSIGWTYEANQNTQIGGTSTYIKVINGNRLEGNFLKFEGVSAYCEIYLNDIKIGENIGAYKSFAVKLTGMKDGENVLKVLVTDKANLELLPENCDDVFSISPRYVRWPVGYGSSAKAGGIWRNVYLVKNTEVYMEPFAIEAVGKEFLVRTAVHGSGDYKISYVMSDENESVCGAVDCSEKSFVIHMPNPVFSWPLKPHLYTFTAQLTDKDGNVVQTIRQPAQLMRLEVRNSEFRLNNRPYFLRGQNGFAHCNIHYDKEYIEKYVGEYKAQGVEISRFHTEPPSHEWLDECDRQGVMVILEMPLHGSIGCYSFASRQFEKNELSEILDIVKEYRRHPSIVFWSMGNELIVACERDIGLGKPLFDILENWIDQVRKLDSRPVIANSNGDAANIVNKSVGDIDDIHQYGGWYVETLYDLRHLSQYTVKNDMLFQPCISTESIAAYTDNEECCFVKNNDVRQRKIVAQRLGRITDLAKQSREYQAFMLKEYAETLWRLRREDSSFSGYIPFGQYTWFFDPFDKEKLSPKSIWNTYKKVMAPVHVQFECFDRHIYEGDKLCGNLGLWHEDVGLPDNSVFKIEAVVDDKVIFADEFELRYHRSHIQKVALGGFDKSGTVVFNVYSQGKLVSSNDISFKVYCKNVIEPKSDVMVYDPEYALPDIGIRIESLGDIANLPYKKLIIGPYALDRSSETASQIVNSWISNGGSVAVLEQNPGRYCSNMFGTSISAVRMCQPQWSRWASNLVRHTDRADICEPDSMLFSGIDESDMFWWNKDTFVANSYLCVGERAQNTVLSQIGNGLASTELMPVEYEYRDSGYSTTALECSLGKGKIYAFSLLIGTKCGLEPVAYKMLNNILKSL